FPPCQQPAQRCQIDHAIPYDKGGETNVDNLGLLCTRHHLLKTHTGWSIVRHRDGVVTWTSPTGHRYYNYPDNYRSYLRTPESPDPPPF
ncbi:MAG: HNH endonuclease, partial [Mycobacterium sp.]|nr:HNH endonuclease [Mycobacterium sp.]